MIRYFIQTLGFIPTEAARKQGLQDLFDLMKFPAEKSEKERQEDPIDKIITRFLNIFSEPLAGWRYLTAKESKEWAKSPEAELIKEQIRNEVRENWSDYKNTSGLAYLIIFLLETRNKQLFGKFLSGTHLLSKSEDIKKAFEKTYDKPIQELKRECINWWLSPVTDQNHIEDTVLKDIH